MQAAAAIMPGLCRSGQSWKFRPFRRSPALPESGGLTAHAEAEILGLAQSVAKSVKERRTVLRRPIVADELAGATCFVRYALAVRIMESPPWERTKCRQSASSSGS